MSLDKEAIKHIIDKHIHEFNLCPRCRRYVPRRASICWACGCDLAEVAVRQYLRRGE